MADQAGGDLMELWRKRVSETRLAYLDAKAAAANLALDVSADLCESPDGGFALRQAIQVETAALQERMKALQVLTDLVVRDKKPGWGEC